MVEFPPRKSWRRAAPGDAGFDPERLGAAVKFVAGAETAWPRSLEAGLGSDPAHAEPDDWNAVIGPTRDRGGPNGVIVRGARVVAQWGEPTRVDMTFSIAKSYLSMLAGVAVKQGLIGSLDDRVAGYALDDGFESSQNESITWRHFLHQSSEWEGSLWGKPDLVDRNRQVGAGADNSRKGTHRDLKAPGTLFEYNDVRVNRFSLALLEIFRRPLAEVLAETIMGPIGATDTWEWLPYRNAHVEIDGERMPSVPGGGHWGGGIFISSEDHARVGLLYARGGVWEGEELLPPGWVEDTCRPSPCNPGYGYLWWLNTARAYRPSAPETSFFALGAGVNVIWVEPTLDLVAVMRWIDDAAVDPFIARVLESLA